MNTTATESVVEQEKINAEVIETWCISYIARTLDIPAAEIDPKDEFHVFGLDSAIATAMILDLEDWLQIEVPPSVIFEQVTISNLVNDLVDRVQKARSKRSVS